jgi:gamma-glutamylcysteine synthetase
MQDIIFLQVFMIFLIFHDINLIGNKESRGDPFGILGYIYIK